MTRRGGAPVRDRRGADGGRDLDSSTALAVLVAITLVAAVARAIGLGSGLWLDEANSLTKVFRLPFGEMLRSYKGENDHPLYSMLAHASMALLGESAWSVRLPAALFGVATVPMLYLLARRIAPRTESLASAAILAVAYHHVWFSQNARGYTAVAFFTVFGLWALLRAVETGRMRDFALYGLGTGLAACIHLT
ncbi:MAG: glycosyltransferase family 39 protein, partial [Deltaproteobacteria bacterium]